MGAASDTEDKELDFEDETYYGQHYDQQHVPFQSEATGVEDRDPVTELVDFANSCCEEFELGDTLKDDVLKACKKHMIDNPATYLIPDSVQANFIHGKQFWSAVSDSASDHRSEIRRKLDKSIEDGTDIYTTCLKLVPPGYQLTEGHAERILFVRLYLKKYNTIDWKTAEEPKVSAWDYVDNKLTQFRGKSKQEQEKALRVNIQKDKKLYPVPAGSQSSFPTVVRAQDWQSDINVAVLAMAEQVQSVRRRAPRRNPKATPASRAVPSPRVQAQELEPKDEQREANRGADVQPGLTGEPGTPDWGHQNVESPSDGARLVNPPAHPTELRADNTATRQLQDGGTGSGTSTLTGAIRNRNTGLGTPGRPSPMCLRSLSGSSRHTSQSGAQHTPSGGTRYSPMPQPRASGSQTSSRLGTPTPSNGLRASLGEEQSHYNPTTSETVSATIGWL
ncbi:hypothetical protein FRC07_001490, partial [Ceratobasidium sp. 392]